MSAVHAGPPAPAAFHDGEIRVQQRLGVAGKMAGVGARVIRDHLIEQHREFFATQHLLLLAHADDARRPWYPRRAIYGVHR